LKSRPPSTDPHASGAARFVALLLTGLAFLLAAAAAVVHVVDPFQQYRLAQRWPPRFYPPLQRYVNPGLARNAEYDRIVIGSSMMENVVPADVDRALGGRTVSLCLSALSAYETRLVLESALAMRDVRHVIVSIDYNGLSGPPRQHLLDAPFPHHLYDRSPLNDFRYLLSGDALLRSLEIVSGARISWARYDPARPWFWGDEYRFGAAETVARLDPTDLNRDFRQPARTREGMRASFEENIVRVIRDHPRTRFSVVLPPYSILVWADFVQRGQLDVTLEFKRLLFDTLLALPNVEVHDFQADATIVSDLAHYKDIYHFSPEVSRELVRALATGSHRVTPAAAQTLLATQRALALAADPQALVSTARRAGSAPR
jgi:hypothetical protein